MSLAFTVVAEATVVTPTTASAVRTACPALRRDTETELLLSATATATAAPATTTSL